jgi:hypothetical protein
MYRVAARDYFPAAVLVCIVYNVCLSVGCGRIGFEFYSVGDEAGVLRPTATDGGTIDGSAAEDGASDGKTIDGSTAADGASDGSTLDGNAAADGGVVDGGAIDGSTAADGASDGGAIDGNAAADGASDGGTADGSAADSGCLNLCENPHGTAECIDGVCVPSCNSGYADCDSNPANGCETALNTLSNCGGCGVSCNMTHASASCSTGSCRLTACDYGYANCDSQENTGCETELMDVTNGLAGFWSLDDGSGKVAADSSEYGHNGTLTNMTGDEWTTGHVNGALQFDGIDDYAEIGNVGAGIKTLSFWMRSDLVVGATTDTEDKAPTANGTTNNGWNNGSNAYVNDGVYASASFLLIGSAAHDWSAFNFGVPAGAFIKGIEAKIETRVSSLSLGSYSISLSWNGGSNYTSSQSIPSGLLGTSEQVYTVGGATDTWGHSWTVDEINNNFHIKANFVAIGLGTVYIDYIRVIVTYIPPDSQKIIDINGAAQIELIDKNISATSFPATTAYYVDGISGTALTSGWHHVIITTTTGVNASTFKLGNVSTGYFVGALDDLRVYDRVLTASEIAFLSETGNTTCPP